LAIAVAGSTGDIALVLSGGSGLLHLDWWIPVLCGAIAALAGEASQGFLLTQQCGPRYLIVCSAAPLRRLPTLFQSFRILHRSKASIIEFWPRAHRPRFSQKTMSSALSERPSPAATRLRSRHTRFCSSATSHRPRHPLCSEVL